LYDLHSEEESRLPIDGADLGRQIAGLHFLLHRMREADGTPMWSTTVVIVVSEMSRDNTDPRTGFNSAQCSDHKGSAASGNQIWPVFGGPIRAPGREIGELDPDTLEVVGGKAIAVGEVYATLLLLLGIESSAYFAHAPIPELLGGSA